MTFEQLAGVVVLIVLVVLGGELLVARRRRQDEREARAAFEAEDWTAQRSKDIERRRTEMDVMSREIDRFRGRR